MATSHLVRHSIAVFVSLVIGVMCGIAWQRWQFHRAESAHVTTAVSKRFTPDTACFEFDYDSAIDLGSLGRPTGRLRLKVSERPDGRIVQVYAKINPDIASENCIYIDMEKDPLAVSFNTVVGRYVVKDIDGDGNFEVMHRMSGDQDDPASMTSYFLVDGAWIQGERDLDFVGRCGGKEVRFANGVWGWADMNDR